MAVNITPLFEPVQLTNAPVVYFTAQATTRIDALTVMNSDAVAHQVTFYWVPRGGSFSTANKIVSARNLQPGESWDVDPFVGHVLGIGDEIAAMADASGVVNLFGSGTAVS